MKVNSIFLNDNDDGDDDRHNLEDNLDIQGIPKAHVQLMGKSNLEY